MKRVLLAASASAFAISTFASTANATTHQPYSTEYKVSFHFSKASLTAFDEFEQTSHNLDSPESFTVYFSHVNSRGPLTNFYGWVDEVVNAPFDIEFDSFSVFQGDDGELDFSISGYNSNQEWLSISKRNSLGYNNVDFLTPEILDYEGTGSWGKVSEVPLPASGLVLLAGLSGLFGRRFFSS